MSLSAGPIFGSRTYHGYYYDIRLSAQRPDRPAYRDDAGYSGASVLAGASQRFDSITILANRGPPAHQDTPKRGDTWTLHRVARQCPRHRGRIGRQGRAFNRDRPTGLPDGYNEALKAAPERFRLVPVSAAPYHHSDRSLQRRIERRPRDRAGVTANAGQGRRYNGDTAVFGATRLTSNTNSRAAPHGGTVRAGEL
jgi:hypothetical protein